MKKLSVNEIILDLAIQQNIELQNERKKLKIEDQYYIEEFATVQLNLGRQTGHTYASFTVLPKYFYNILYVYNNENQCSHAKDKCITIYDSLYPNSISSATRQKIVLKSGQELDFISNGGNSNSHIDCIMCGKSFDCICLDCYNYMPKDKLMRLNAFIAINGYAATTGQNRTFTLVKLE